MTSDEPIKVTLIATPEVDASALTGIHGVLSSFSHMVPGSISFKPVIASPDNVWTDSVGTDRVRSDKERTASESPEQIIRNVVGMPLPLQSRLSDIQHTDVLIIPSLYLLDNTWPENPYPDLTDWLLRMHRQGTLICSACTGAMLLAETGLLDGQEATQHWAFEQLFRNHFPKVRLNIDKVLTITGDNQQIIMSGASAAWHDLLIYLISRYASPHAAQTIAKFFLLNAHTEGQKPYIIFNDCSQHEDGAIQRAQQWLGKNSRVPHPIEHMQKLSGLSPRTFSRRFQQATGVTPIHYIQHLRVENAKLLLETCRMSVDEIGWEVGYEDPAFFRRLFKRLTGMTPKAYRRKFQPADTNTEAEN
ncbi:GlxA family transcriptional regulator [Hahella ganghwensis]|uniref:GlxA family transcriptional regulator n=1 Tax=Hahella ganghwensis TaxID=286420 RepID=UPI00036F2344|nr:helix-turn-helix domain-containing protein [Hahella ganghwensis]